MTVVRVHGELREVNQRLLAGNTAELRKEIG